MKSFLILINNAFMTNAKELIFVSNATSRNIDLTIANVDIARNITIDKFIVIQKYDEILRHVVKYHLVFDLKYQHFSLFKTSLNSRISRLHLMHAFSNNRLSSNLRYLKQYSLRNVCMQMQS